MNREKPNRLLWLAALAIALQAMVPAGYMPAPIASGLPFVLCPGGLPGAASFIADLDGAHDDGAHGARRGPQHEHTDGEAQSSAEWEFCPFGAVFGATALVAEYETPFPLLETDTPAADTDRIVQSVLTPFSRARAPPTNPPIDV